MSDDTDRRPVWPWAVLGVFLAYVGWNTFAGTQAMGRMAAENARLGAAGTAPGDEWLALLKADPAAAHAAASAGFRQRVPADRLATLVVPDPAGLTVGSFGGGSVTTRLFGPPTSVSPRLKLDSPGGLSLEFVVEGEEVRLDAVAVNGADPFATP